MQPDDIGRGYDTIAERWQDAGFPANNGLAAHARALQFCTAKNFALDVGCGCNPRLPVLLRSAGFSTTGVDVSRKMLEMAQDTHAHADYVLADICSWPLPRQYDLITAWDSIWNVPLAQQAGVMQKLLKGLAPTGVLIFTMGGLDAPSEKIDAVMGPQMYYSTLGIPDMLGLIAAAGCLVRHLEFDQHPEPHLYLIVQAPAA